MFRYDCNDLSQLCMRSVARKDLGFLLDLRNDPTTWMQLVNIGFLNEAQQDKWYQSLADTSKQFYIIEEPIQSVPIGIIKVDEIDQLNRSLRVGADIARAHRGQGYGTKTYRMLLEFCFHHLNAHRVWLEVLESNSVGIALYKKIGFKEEGRLREAVFRNGIYQDCVVMSILESEYAQ